jgi:hypothetical protein
VSRRADGVWLIDEDNVRAIFLPRTYLATMHGGKCPAPGPRNVAQTAPPSFDHGSNFAKVTVRRPGNAAPLELDAGRQGSIIDARLIGTLGDGRSVVFWRSLDALPRAGVAADNAQNYRSQGRIGISLFVTVFDARGRQIATQQLRDFAFQAGAGATLKATFDGMKKRGFEYVAVSKSGWLYLMRDADDNFVVERLPIPGPDSASQISFYGPSQRSENEGAAGEPAPGSDSTPSSQPTTWEKALRGRAGAYANAVWYIPTGGMARPCKDNGPECSVMLNATGDVVASDEGKLRTGEGTPVTQKAKDLGRAIWKRPTYLRDAHDGDMIVGMPYSYGGSSHLDALPVSPPADAAGAYSGPPFGHIVETLQILLPDGKTRDLNDTKYPIGIDCSRLIARLFGGFPSTTKIVGEDGKLAIPANFFPIPVEHATKLKPGDVLVKHGHVVVFNRVVFVGYDPTDAGFAAGRAHGAVGYEVFEATSRCGRVCRSVYGPEFFNGWWIIRPRHLVLDDGSIIENPAGEPSWDSAAPVSYPVPTND